MSDNSTNNATTLLVQACSPAVIKAWLRDPDEVAREVVHATASNGVIIAEAKRLALAKIEAYYKVGVDHETFPDSVRKRIQSLKETIDNLLTPDSQVAA